MADNKEIKETIQTEKVSNQIKETPVFDKGPNLGNDKPKTNLYGRFFVDAIDALAVGENPSKKILVQHLSKAGDNYDELIDLYETICGPEEFIPVGYKAEYILTNDIVVNKLDPNILIATTDDFVNPSDHTYVDEIELPDIDWGSTLTPQFRPLLKAYLLKFYYNSGLTIDQIYANITGNGAKMMFKYKFYTFMVWLKRIYDYLTTKTQSTSITNLQSNYYVDNTTGAVDSFEHFKMFINYLCSVSNKYMLGKVNVHFDDETHEEVYDGIAPFEKCYNKANLSDLVFLTDKQTLTSIKKWLAMLPQEVNSLINLSQFKTIPLSFLNVHKPQGKPNDLPDIIKTNDFFTKNSVYQPGTILVLQKHMLKSVFNYQYNGVEDYKKPNAYQLIHTANYNMKPIKFMICGIYQNAHIQDSFAVPVTEVNEGE